MPDVSHAKANPFGVDPLVTERTYRLRRFEAVAEGLVGRKVAVYGTGLVASDVASRLGGRLDIVALVDDARVGETALGRTVSSLEGALELGAEVVVIAAKSSSELAVARRIGATCRACGVELVDLYGNDVSSLASHDTASSRQELMGLLGDYDVLCVDASPLMANLLEGWAAKRAGASDIGDELLCLVAEARRLGLRVMAVAEPWEVGARSSRFLGIFDEVVWAADYGCTKETGLYRVVLSRVGGLRTIHVGPSVDRDALMPRLVGIDGFCLEGDAWEVQPTPASEDPVARCEAEATVLSLVGAEGAGDAPFDFGYRALGPVLLGHAAWVARRVQERHLNGVVFPSRDGWLMRQVYEAYRGANPGLCLPASCYLYTSRKAALAALLDEGEFRGMLPSIAAGLTSREMLSDYAGLDVTDLADGPSYDVDEEACRQRAVEANAAAIGRVAKARREAMLRHFESRGLEAGRSYAFCDFVALGTNQFLLQQLAPFGLEGLYVGRRRPASPNETDEVRSFLSAEGAGLEARFLEVEQAMCSPEPATVGFDEAGDPVFAPETRTGEDIATMLAVHDGVMALVRDCLGRLGSGDCKLRASFAAAVFGRWRAGVPRLHEFDDLTGRGYNSHPGHASRSVCDVLMGMLSAFDRVCTEHGLTYVAVHGTLLGAVRDKGLVPGDDDLDVAMPRGDYDRLVELARRGAFPEPYFLQTPENDPTCFCGGYARLRDSSTAALVPGDEGRPCNQGMWMDVMPLDHCPSSDAAVERRQGIVRTWQRALYAKTYGFDMRRLWGTDPRKMSLYFLLADHMGRDTLLRCLRRACTACRPTGTLTIFCGNYRNRRNDVRFSAADVAGARRVPFGGTTIPIPRNAEAWLERRYGAGWREVAGDGGGRTAHDVVLDPNTPYDVLLDEMRRKTDG